MVGLPKNLSRRPGTWEVVRPVPHTGTPLANASTVSRDFALFEVSHFPSRGPPFPLAGRPRWIFFRSVVPVGRECREEIVVDRGVQ